MLISHDYLKDYIKTISDIITIIKINGIKFN